MRSRHPYQLGMRIHISMAPCPVPAPPESTPSRKREKRLDIGRIHERHYELELTVWSPLSTPMARPREFHAEPSSAAGGSIKDKVKIRGSPRVSNEQSIECDQASENQAWLAPSPRRHLPWPYTSQPLHLEKTGKSYHAPLSSLGDTRHFGKLPALYALSDLSGLQLVFLSGTACPDVLEPGGTEN
ncbi:hypothetical protein D6C77_04922 [Aureobasidium pullulans]|uniref:Uncharacterized protein n=1 Tax=Aureobasidium pullulans TaxID=5580 RepID=A0A4V4LDH6_AURPU|nr:hypothetical protein D6D21_07960 [Aureobasidium pullulans]THW61585.1 hypothetical protein D6D20_04942 [Aureobasidium pullulans]THY53199.1 hypothetical protein D6C97_06153 [Aureobasidium pullulans]TIA32057.1 hypothetical protein D6C78_08496 [Aureobasidium pullulans]TIA59365.1 hypothetical protein D6C77_04922 [Aureobasidium pullulans]